MNVLATPPPPHQLSNPRLSPSRSMSSYTSTGSASRKRKAEDDEPQVEDRMSFSPSNSPAPTTRSLPTHRHTKKSRSGPAGRPLALPRLLETLDANSLRTVLQSLCTRHPEIGSEVEQAAPRPTVSSALNVLKSYESALQASFPFGGDSSSDYAYNRVRESFMALLDALADFTPHFLPPNETQASQSLVFLDGATDIIHNLPDWSSFQNSLHKQNAYEEISGAWALAIREAAKRAGGMQLQYGGWDQKLAKHNQQANGKLQDAMNELSANIGWMGGQPQPQQSGSRGDDLNSVRQELLSGTYGRNLPEYRDQDDQDIRLDSTSKYIKSRSGAVFAIRVVIPKIFSFASDALAVFLYLDGTYIESGIFERGLHDHRFKGTFGVGEGGFGYKEFTFSEIKLDENTSTSKGKEAAKPAVADLGTILVQVFRMRIVGPRIKGAGSPSPAPGLRDELQVSEMELKGRSVTHSAKLGGFKPSLGRDTMKTEYVDGATSPLAVFRFKYCSRKALQGLLLVPRTPTLPRSPTPVPLEERPFDELNAAEKDELVRRQQARYRAERESRPKLETGVKMERGIKRERDEEYDEMIASASAKKVKGPIADGEIVELSDED